MKPELYESAPLCLPPMSETHPRSLLGVGRWHCLFPLRIGAPWRPGNRPRLDGHIPIGIDTVERVVVVSTAMPTR